MKTFAATKCLAVLLLALALPCVARAQPVDAASRGVADTITGVDAPPPGMAMAVPALRPDLVKDYLRALEAVNMAVEFEARGETRRQLGVDRVSIDARWERRPGETSPSLRGMTIKPEGGRLNLGGMSVNKVTIDDRGVMKLDIHRFPDLTVKKITRSPNGDIKLHIDWFPDITIKANGAVKLFGFLGVGSVPGANAPLGDVVANWPPQLEDVVNAVESFSRTPRAPTTTRHAGTVRYELSGRASPFDFPLGSLGGNLPAATDFSLRGAAVLEPDGTFRTVGSGNTMSVNVRVGGRGVTAGPVSGRVENGTASFSGRYDVSIPLGRKENMVLGVDGDVSYAIDGSDVTLNLPTGTRVRVGDLDVSGSAHLRSRVAPSRGAPSIVLSDGTYRLDASGPISVAGLRVHGLTSEELGFDGRVRSAGSFEPAGAGLTVRGTAEGELTTTGPGVVDVLSGETRARGTVRAGSRVSFGVDEFTATTAPDAAGELALSGAEGRGRVDADLDLDGVDASSGGNRVTADRVHAAASFTLAGSDRGLSAASGSTTVRLDSDAALAARLPGASLPGALGEPAGTPSAGAASTTGATHRVAAGDTLSAISRRYGTTVAALRAANGLSGDLIRVGDTLRLPGGAAAPARPAAPATGPAADGSVNTTLASGSSATVDVRSARMTDAGLEVDGHVAARVTVNGLEARAGLLEARILGAARASLDTDFSLRAGAGRRPVVNTGSFRVPVRIEISRGSRVLVKIPGKECDVEMDRDGSFAEFTAVVKLVDGRLQLDELTAVDVLLVSNGAARFGGNLIDVAGEKSLRYAGRIVVRERGLDFYGEISVSVRGSDDTPIVRIRW